MPRLRAANFPFTVNEHAVVVSVPDEPVKGSFIISLTCPHSSVEFVDIATLVQKCEQGEED